MDEDNEPVKSAVLEFAEPKIAVKKESNLDKIRKIFENAWVKSGEEERNKLPYLSRSALLNYLVSDMGFTESYAQKTVKPSSSGKMVFELLNANIIENFENGYLLTDLVQSSAMLISKGFNRVTYPNVP